MSKAEELREMFADQLSKMQEQAYKAGRYFIFYTHRFEQVDEEKANILVFPNDPRFDEQELVGLCIDMIMDYYDKTGRKVKGDKMLLGASLVLKKLYKNGLPNK